MSKSGMLEVQRVDVRLTAIDELSPNAKSDKLTDVWAVMYAFDALTTIRVARRTSREARTKLLSGVQ